MGEKLITGIIFLISVIFFGIAFTIPPPHTESPLGSAFWPKLVLLLLFITSGSHLARLFLRTKEAEAELRLKAAEKQKSEEDETGERLVAKLVIFGMVSAYLYIFAVRYVGFAVASPLFMMIFMYITGYRKPIMSIVISFCTIAAFLLLFVKATYIPLPRGYGIFKSISVLFY